MKLRKGLTLIEVILAIALIGIISVSFTSVFSSQINNIVTGGKLTQGAFDEQGKVEEIIYEAKSRIQTNQPLNDITQWSEEDNIEVLGQNVTMQKLNYENADSTGKAITVYLSDRLAKEEVRNTLTVENVSIDVSNDPNNLVADLTTAPSLTAIYDDNSGQTNFYSNIFRWWRTEPGVDPTILSFPGDYVLISVSQDKKVLTNLLDNVGANSYVLLTVTPVDVNGNRGSSVMSSNVVYVRGAEWRIGSFPWVDMNNNYNFESLDHQLVKESIIKSLDTRTPYPNPTDPSLNLDLSNGSLFVPMGIDPSSSSEPGNQPIVLQNSDRIEWLIEGNINLAKDINVLNNSDIKLKSGLGSNGGNVFIHPYVELKSDGNPLIVGGVPQLLNTGVSLKTSGDISLETAGRGSIQLYGNAELIGKDISLKSRGNIGVSNSKIESNGNIILDNESDRHLASSRKITLNETDFISSNLGSKITMNSPEEIYIKGGSWSNNQTIYIKDGQSIYFESGINRVNNLGLLNLGNTATVRFKNTMLDDLSNKLSIRVAKKSDTEMRLIPHNYYRNIGYSSDSTNIVFNVENMWRDIGKSNSNMEFSSTILSGEGNVNDMKFSFNGTDVISIEKNTNKETDKTRIRLEFRDKYSNKQIKGMGIFSYEIDSRGNAIIVVEDEIPVDTYFITFDSKGGTPVDIMKKNYKDPIDPPPNPTKNGYSFQGWEPELPSSMPNYDFKVVAKWKPNEYIVTFNGEGGQPNKETKTIYYGDSYSSIYDTPYRSGFNFIGWYTTRDGSGQKIERTDIYTSLGNQNLYARWSPNQVMVTFNGNQGNPEYKSKNVTFGEKYGSLPGATRTGYKFDGWYTNTSGGTLITDSSDVKIDGNHTLYARWSANQYTVTFDSNGGKNPSFKTKNVTYGGTYGTLPTVSKSNSRFDGWYTEDGTPISQNTLVNIAGNHTIYALWSDSGVSCPFVYSYDGTNYHFEHESIPFSISKVLETTSYGTLRKLESVNGKFKVRIAEELDEKSFVNGFSLYAVDYPKKSNIDYVKVDIFGEPHTIVEKQHPVNFIQASTDKDLLYEATTEGVLIGSDFRNVNTNDFMTNYEIEFEKPSNEVKVGKFLITVQKSNYTTILGEYYLDKIGATTDFWWMEKILELPFVDNRFEEFMKVITLKVEVWDGEKWIEQGNIKAGRDLMEEFLVPIDLSVIDIDTDKLHIRLSHGAGLFEIDTVSMDYSINQIESVRELNISSALLNQNTDVFEELQDSTDNKRTKLTKGDKIDIEFLVPQIDKNMKRGYFVGLTGYYYMDPEIKEASDILEAEDKSIRSQTKNILESIKSINKDNWSSIKWVIGLINESYKKPLEEKVELIIKSQYYELLDYINSK